MSDEQKENFLNAYNFFDPDIGEITVDEHNIEGETIELVLRERSNPIEAVVISKKDVYEMAAYFGLLN